MRRRIAHGLGIALLACLGAFAPSTAQAQGSAAIEGGGGMDLHLFRPAVDSKGHFTVNGTDILGHRDFSFGLILDYGRNIMPYSGFENDDTIPAGMAERTSHLVDNYVTGTLHFNFGLVNRLVVGVQLPIYFIQGSNIRIQDVYNDTSANGMARLPQGLDTQGIGDLKIHGKFRILRAERDPIGLAAILRIGLPTGDAQAFGGEPGVSLWPSLVGEWRPHRVFRLSLELGYRIGFGDGATLPVGGRSMPSDLMGNALDAVNDPSQPGTQVDYSGGLMTFGLGMSVRAAESLDITGEIYGTQLAG
ncbi:MAG: OOP family OmpA-OmpF porin, partial [Polyangiales bacterium]